MGLNFILVDEDPDVITHTGLFHADDCMCIALAALQVLPTDRPMRVARRNPTEAELDDPTILVLDVGGRYEPKKLNYDHHQRGYKEARWDTEFETPYAAVGLLWGWSKGFLEEYGTEVHAYLDRVIIEPIDAADSGLWPTDAPSLSFSSVIHRMNCVEDAQKQKERFKEAVELCHMVFNHALKDAREYVEAKDKVAKALKERGLKEVLVLPEYVPWQGHVHDADEKAEVLFVVHPSPRGGWAVWQVPEEKGSQKGRKPLPEDLAGLRGAELAEAAGLEKSGEATFVHQARFCGGAETQKDAIALAVYAVAA